MDILMDKKSSFNHYMVILCLFLLLASTTQVEAGSSKKSGWEIIDLDIELDILNLISTEGDEVWGFGENGLIIYSTDKGNNWTILDSVISNNLSFSDYQDGTLIAGGSDGIIIQKVQDDDWNEIRIPDDMVHIRGIAISSDESIFAVGNKGAIWYYDGLDWENKSINDIDSYNSVSFIDNGINGVIAGDEGIIMTTLDGGNNWELIEVPETIRDSNIISLELFSGARAYATTEDGEILVSRSLETSIGFEWELVSGDNLPHRDDIIINHIEVITTNKIITTGSNRYIATSKDGGNTFEEHNLSLIPLKDGFILYHIEMIDGFCGVASGSNGIILVTGINNKGCTEGLDQYVGFEIEQTDKFGQFADKYADWMLEGLMATMKIVIFGILFGFMIGISLAMCKTAPTSLKDLIESYLERLVLLILLQMPIAVLLGGILNNRAIGFVILISSTLFLEIVNYMMRNNLTDNEGFLRVIIPKSYRLGFIRLIGFSLLFGLPTQIRGGLKIIFDSIKSFSDLDLSGIGYLYTPVGAPESFFYLLFGIGITIPGMLLITSNGKYSTIKGLDLWGLRPLNSLATLYTDLFRNTPLIVQFFFLHFGIEIGRILCDSIYVLNDRIYISAICALALNSGAYQCETLRGAIAAIPSGQMEAGRSIGLTYMQTMKLVILPQSIRICIPPLGNEMVNLVLNSSLAMVIGYNELSRQGKLITAITFEISWTWGMVMISYFVVTWTLALILRRLEAKTRIPGLGIV